MQTTSLSVSAPNQFVERNGYRLAYRRFGVGQTILLGVVKQRWEDLHSEAKQLERS